LETIEFKNKKEIEVIFQNANDELFNQKNIKVIKYSEYKHETFDKNNKPLLENISNKPIIYCIWTGSSIDDFSPKYVGCAASKYSRGRIRAHLAFKSEKTSSQLKAIKNEIEKEKIIGLSVIIIEPEYMRKSLEEWLIVNNFKKLEWNKGRF
jgi:hypothetical protein